MCPLPVRARATLIDSSSSVTAIGFAGFVERERSLEEWVRNWESMLCGLTGVCLGVSNRHSYAFIIQRCLFLNAASGCCAAAGGARHIFICCFSRVTVFFPGFTPHVAVDA